jgi:cytoskeletal protein CcmA (bactofilin family)
VGNIHASSIAVEEGAFLSGHVDMSGSKHKPSGQSGASGKGEAKSGSGGGSGS